MNRKAARSDSRKNLASQTFRSGSTGVVADRKAVAMLHALLAATTSVSAA